MKKTQKLFREFIEDVTFRKRIKAFVDKQKSSYVEKLEKVKDGIGNIIKSIELGNIIQGKCRYCPR